MGVAVGVTGILGVLIALYGLSGEEGERVTRRAWARLAILAATGLSFFPGCGSDRPPPAVRSLLRRWAKLGRIWREMSVHRRGEWDPYFEGAGRFLRLQEDMRRALEALPAWPELSIVFERRWQHILQLRYQYPICYPPTLSTTCLSVPPEYAVEQQVEELERLVGEQRLSKAAALRAAEVIAVQAERMLNWGIGENIQPGPAALLAGERLTELTADKLGWLARRPREGEGFPPTNRKVVDPLASRPDDS
jgi:hypothetical protein